MGRKVSKLVAERNKAEKEAIDLIGVAQMYYEDGALATAADRLRKAAELLDQAAKLKAEAFAEASRGSA